MSKLFNTNTTIKKRVYNAISLKKRFKEIYKIGSSRLRTYVIFPIIIKRTYVFIDRVFDNR
jgi:hypothetical protein